jgi:hypothetical protein
MANEPIAGSTFIAGAKASDGLPGKVGVNDALTPPGLYVDVADRALRDLGKVDIAGFDAALTSPTVSHASSNGTPIVATTTGIVSAPSSGNHLRLMRLHASNGGATSTWVAWRDGAAGTQHYRSFLPTGGTVSMNLAGSGPLDLTTATRLDIVLSAAGSVEYEVDYQTVAD